MNDAFVAHPQFPFTVNALKTGFNAAFRHGIGSIAPTLSPDKVVAFDGKPVDNPARSMPLLHLVSAFSTETSTVLGQLATA